jgi:very-short-patch-repair endonuclease
MKKCENCNKTHTGKYGSGRFCSEKCSRGFSTKNKREEINIKVSKKLKGSGNADLILSCKYCYKEFNIGWNKRDQMFCSFSCSSKEKWKNSEYRRRISEISCIEAFKKHADPNIKFGWTTRKKLSMSYPEKIADAVLKQSKILYEHEYPFYKFFIDFAILDKKIAIEIDGRQHNEPKRKESDERKDKKLTNEGWKVFRIKWPDDNIKEEIKKILKSIPSH